MKGEMSSRLAGLVGPTYAGLMTPVQPGDQALSRDSGRLAGSWSGGVATQKGHLNTGIDLAGGEPLGTVHHTVSDHALGWVHAGVTRVGEGGGDGARRAGDFRNQVAADSLYGGSEPDKALFQLRQNLTYGPLTEHIDGDPGSGFDAGYQVLPPGAGRGAIKIDRDYDDRSRQLRPIHNMAMLLKSGQYQLTPDGVSHMTTLLGEARRSHEASLAGKTYTAYDKHQRAIAGPDGTRPLTVPIRNVDTGDFETLPTGKVRKKRPKPRV
jgi:hypothetical protein